MKREAHFDVYKSADGWRWRIKAANGRIVADGGEAYARRAGATRAVAGLIRILAADIPVVQREVA